MPNALYPLGGVPAQLSMELTLEAVLCCWYGNTDAWKKGKATY